VKKSKSKKNWFKVQFEKHPYLYSVLLGWIIFIVPGLNGFYRSWSNKTGEAVVLILFLFTLATLFLWFQKNKTKIKPFYKRNKKIFNRVYFYLGSVFSLIPIACIVGIITTGGISNFIERTKFEINVIIISYQKFDYCQSPNIISYSGYPKDHRIFFFKEQTQYIDYVGDNIEKWFIRDLELLNANHCVGTRYLLKEAQKGNEAAKEILVAYPPGLRSLYSFPPTGNSNKYIFSKYEKNIANMNLNNPAIAYSYAIHLDDTFLNRYWWDEKPFSIKASALEYLNQSAEDGYFLAMQDILSIYAHKEHFNDVNCDTYLKYTNTLADEKSLIGYYTLMNGYMGKISSEISRTIYKCLGNKPNFSKAFSMLMDRPTEGYTSTSQLKKSNNFNSSYPAIFYLYGLGDVEQDYTKAYELFSYSEDKIYNTGIPDHAYLAYMNYMGMGTEQNLNKGKGLTVELAKKMSLPIEIKQLCNLKAPNLLALEYYWGKKILKGDREKKRIKYDADKKINEKNKKKYRDKLGECLLKSEHEVSIKFLEDYIFNRVSDFFKNPELVQKLNYLGKVN
jgi:hypothetical protein